MSFVYVLKKKIGNTPLCAGKNDSLIENRFLVTYERLVSLCDEQPAFESQFKLRESTTDTVQFVVRKWQFDILYLFW